MSNEHEAPESVYLGRCHPCQSDWDFYVADPSVSRGTIEYVRADRAPVLPPPGMVLVPRLVLTRIKLASEIARIGNLEPLAEYLDEITALAQPKEGA